MKRIKSFIGLLLTAVLLLGISNLFATKLTVHAAETANGTCGDNLTWTLTDDGTLTISGTGAMTDYSSKWSMPWSDYRSDIDMVIIKNGVTTIGDYAFAGFYFDNISIANSVKSIGFRAFFDSGIDEIVIPDSVTRIEHSAFRGSTTLRYVVIPDSVTSIGDSAFASCTDLHSIVIPASVESIGSKAFQLCGGLYFITFDGTPPTISDDAFESCDAYVYYPPNKQWTSAERQNYGGTLEWFETGANAVYASGTVNDTITWKITTDGTLTITGTGKIPDFDYDDDALPPWVYGIVRYLVIEDGITRIGDISFEEVYNLTKVSIADSVTSIGNRAFYWCTNLTEVTIPKSVTRIGEQAFSDCNSRLYEKENGITYVDNWAIDCEYEATTAVLRPGTVGVANSTFWQPYLTAIYVNDDNPNYTDIDGVLYNKAETELVRYPGGRSGAYTIPEGVTSIRDAAINWQDGLTALTIPKSITSIGQMSITGCNDLTEITFLGTKPPAIDETAFGGTTATVYYPNTKLWTEDVRQDHGGTLTWVAYEAAYSDICGDADGDNEITDWDGILLSRYLAGWTVSIENISAMDTDGDGEITDWDGVLLDRYLAGWNVNSQIGK